MKTVTETIELTPREFEAMQADQLGAVLRLIEPFASGTTKSITIIEGTRDVYRDTTSGQRTRYSGIIPFAVGDVAKLRIRNGQGYTDYKETITEVRAVLVSGLRGPDLLKLGIENQSGLEITEDSKPLQMFHDSLDAWCDENPNAPFETSWAFFIGLENEG